MKMIVKLAVLFTTLLLLTGESFARDCYCYEVVATNLDTPANSQTIYPVLCFDYDNTGDIYSKFGPGEMSLFFDPMREQALGFDPKNPSCVGYFKFHGDWLYVLTGIGYCVGDRWQLKGHQIDRNDQRCFD